MDKILKKLRSLGFTEDEIRRYMRKSHDSSTVVQCLEKRDNTAYEISCVIYPALNPAVQENESTSKESTLTVVETVDVVGGNNRLSAEKQLDYEERAAIMEYDGNLQRKDAEKEALKLITEKSI